MTQRQQQYTCRKLALHTSWYGLLWLLVWSFNTGCGSPQTHESLPSHMVRGGWVAKNDMGDVLSGKALQSMQGLWDLGTRWIALGPEVTMKDIHRPELIYNANDASFRKFVRWGRNRGFQFMLMPRIESPAFFQPPFPFRADIQMLSSDHRDQFFKNYEKMLVHYGKLCEEEGIHIFAIGLEYLKLVKNNPARWRTMIKAVRKVYKGKLTYSANWYEEYKAITFWDDLDLIGVGAYFELSVPQNARVSTIKKAWRPIVPQLQTLSEKYNKPILFTEIGYTSFADAAQYPWKWQSDLTRPLSPQHQADSFTAMFQTFSTKPWFYGLFVWRFYTQPTSTPAYDYNPIGKPTEGVLQQWFRKDEPETPIAPMK